MALAKNNYACENCKTQWHAADPHNLGLLCPGCHGKLQPIPVEERIDDSTLKTLKDELKTIFARMRASEAFDEGFFLGLEGAALARDEYEQPILRYELGSTEYDDFVEGYDIGARTKKWLEST